MDQATIRDKSRMFKERICKGCVGKKMHNSDLFQQKYYFNRFR